VGFWATDCFNGYFFAILNRNAVNAILCNRIILGLRLVTLFAQKPFDEVLKLFY
jgi:hypothetical protein